MTRKLTVKTLALLLAALMVMASLAAVSAEEFAPGPKLGDKRVRQALLYALDRENFILAQYGSTDIAKVGLAPLSPTSWAFPDESDLNAYAYDLDKAAALLDEAGWTLGGDGYRYNADGLKLSVKWLVYEDSPWPVTLSSMAYDSWKQIGVDLVIDRMDFNTVAAMTMDPEPGEKDFDIYTMGFSLGADPDPSGGLFDYEAFSAGGFNASGYYNEHSQTLIKEGKTTFGTEERAAIYKEWATFMNEEVPTSIVAYRSEIWGVNDRVSGLDLGTYADWTDVIRNVTLEGDQILKLGETSFDSKFNPIYADKVYDQWINYCVFESPIKVNAEGEYVSTSIADYELSNENKTYTFTLKEGVKFSDGEPLTTEDFYFTYTMIAHPEYTGPRLSTIMNIEGYDEYAAGTADTISGVQIIDERTISFTFKDASPANIVEFVYGIVPKHIYDDGAMEGFLSYNMSPVGSGPLVFADYAPNQFILLEANENYWDPDNAVQIEGVYITMVPDESKIAALELGELDFAMPTANIDNLRAIESIDGVHVVSYLGNGYTYICFNTLN
ncbi:MAG: ABC transporter substrate-binding protein [Oscillospiraceae bacterium]|jgi:ABC-type transport system substrate-binding protein|nr:ABC transporter substrate-binding protein [Oscillospiraceae bacterium]